MISYIRGELISVEEDRITVDVGGVGFGIFMSGRAMSMLPPAGNEILVYTYLNVKEDCMQLFGFLTRDELQVFRMILGVNGIGPKGGLSILAHLTPNELRFAVMSHDAKAISAAPGIGRKSAEKLILELKDKLKIDEIPNDPGTEEGPTGTSAYTQLESETVQALEALGYGRTEAARAVRQAEVTEESTVETILKQALKALF